MEINFADFVDEDNLALFAKCADEVKRESPMPALVDISIGGYLDYIDEYLINVLRRYLESKAKNA